jgi:4-diphosphocytidyl-2C-methyl-D-erythritol kinase
MRFERRWRLVDGGRGLRNRQQIPAERLCPAVARVREPLAGFRPAGMLMSGSGSSMVARCRDHPEALRDAGGLEGGR